MSALLPAWKYPPNWKKASKVLRRIIGHCEECGAESNCLSVHHVGTPYPDGRPGDHKDKHDLRRENLQVICFSCHDRLEHIGKISKKKKQQKAKRRARLEAHRALGIGTGLVLYQRSVVVPSFWKIFQNDKGTGLVLYQRSAVAA